MGDYSITVRAVGGHGCQREVKDGGTLAEKCGIPGCPDCMAREFVRELKAAGNTITAAVLRHWPADHPHYDGASEVSDNLVTHKRRGSF